MRESGRDQVRITEIRSLAEQISPRFTETNSDVRNISEVLQDPFALAALIYKLAQERDRTNKILSEINEKLDALTDVKAPAENVKPKELTLKLLPLADKKIMSLFESREAVSASDVKRELGYSGQNGASARLNSLHKQGLLNKIRSGKTIFFVRV